MISATLSVCRASATLLPRAAGQCHHPGAPEEVPSYHHAGVHEGVRAIQSVACMTLHEVAQICMTLHEVA